jgi:hypothetical protein
MKFHHHLVKSSLVVALLVLGATGSCFAKCNIVAVAATETHDGIVHILPNGVATFGLGTTNVGTACELSVTPVPGVNGSTSTPSNLTAAICETNPQTLCTIPTAPTDSLALSIGAGAQPTFFLFLQATETVPPGAEVCVIFFSEPTGETGGLNSLPSQRFNKVCVPVVTSGGQNP